MFSLIKFLQEKIRQLKSNKGLWFTTLSVLSILGIIVTLAILTTLTSRVSKKVYNNMAETYELKIDTLFENKRSTYKKIAISLSNDSNLVNELNTNNSQALTTISKNINTGLSQSGFQSTVINFYVNNAAITQRNSINTVINTKREIFGVEVMGDGVFIILAEPVIDGDRVAGVIEVKENISVFKNDFIASNQKYVFLLEDKMLQNISLEAKSGRYLDVIDNLKVKQEDYDSKFYTNLSQLDKDEYKEFRDIKFDVNDEFYTTYKKATDINGADIGIYLVGEVVEDSDGFVNIADNMTKTVTTVALGLVISILLFMF